MTLLALSVALALSGQTASPRPGSDLTRDLNSAPPSTVTPAPSTSTQAPAPARSTTQALPPIGQTPAATPRPAPTTPSNRTNTQTLPPIGQSPAATPRAASSSTPTPGRPATPPAASTPSPRPAPTAAAPQAATTAPAPVAPAPAALNAAAIAALPFRVELPSGFTITPARAGADANIYRIQRGDVTLVMIYAGPSSQFPIYDGDMVRTGGRASVVVTEGGRRLAMEHLFQRATAPKEIHVWIASVTGADRDLAERIGQSVDMR
nr:hypothetical protein [uncultured Brevundimonas sp.]